MNHWYDYVFWIFFGAGMLLIVTIIIHLIAEKFRKPLVSTYDPAANPSPSSDQDTEWGVGGTDSSTGFDSGGSWND